MERGEILVDQRERREAFPQVRSVRPTQCIWLISSVMSPNV